MRYVEKNKGAEKRDRELEEEEEGWRASRRFSRRGDVEILSAALAHSKKQQVTLKTAGIKIPAVDREFCMPRR